MRKDIQALNKKIDELSATYNRKLKLSENTKEEVEVHSVAQDSAADHQAPNPAMADMWNKMIQPFLEAQWRFYSIYNYGKTPETSNTTPGVQYVRWGSRYTRDEGFRPNNWNPARNDRQANQSRNWYGRNGPSGGFQGRYVKMRPGSFQMGQPRKRLRFTEWIQADKARQPNEGTSHEHDQSRQIDIPQNAMDSMNLQVAPSKDGGRSMRSERPSAPKDVVKESIGVTQKGNLKTLRDETLTS